MNFAAKTKTKLDLDESTLPLIPMFEEGRK